MIIFDLDGTLANCEHRRHFVEDPCDTCGLCYDLIKDGVDDENIQCMCGKFPARWKRDWKAFFEACDQDIPIEPIVGIWSSYEVRIACYPDTIKIWTGRCESVRTKTVDWLNAHLFCHGEDCWDSMLKMRPIGNHTPDDQLKERWLDEYLTKGGKPIELVYEDRSNVVKMWRRRGITCLQVADGDF